MNQQANEQQRAGRVRWTRQPTPYERFMAEEGIPVVRGIGLYDVRELPLSSWPRLGGRGSYIQLDGTEAVWGMYVVEIAPRSELKPERHLYEELYYVVEGRGSTEVWKENASRRQVFEWQPGSLFSVPVNCWHRLVNAGSSPVLVLAATGAPALMNIINNSRSIFEVLPGFL
ncbi:MAG: cupin domain-containing protein, partial [Deltaproteobacteria bacterium]|nr:cupin domain-containing protein [Deltaproteobacteria bacterium]